LGIRGCTDLSTDRCVRRAIERLPSRPCERRVRSSDATALGDYARRGLRRTR
jgi:hypothetical protein